MVKEQGMQGSGDLRGARVDRGSLGVRGATAVAVLSCFLGLRLAATLGSEGFNPPVPVGASEHDTLVLEDHESGRSAQEMPNPWLLQAHVAEKDLARSRKLQQTNEEETYIRNGQVFTTFGVPADSSYWNQRFQLYDRYGNYRLQEDYRAPVGKLQGWSASVTDAGDLLAPPASLNEDMLASFWYGQQVTGGRFAHSYPGRPWIRQALPYTCDTNPHNECPHANRDSCISDGCSNGRKSGKPIVTPNGGEYETSILVNIEVEGTRMYPSELPSAPVIPITGFHNGVCNSTCSRKPTWPACLDQLDPLAAVYGTKDLGGFLRSDLVENPCKGASKMFRRNQYECRCNVERLQCEEKESFCTRQRRQCSSVEGRPCLGIPERDKAEQTCGPPELGGICTFGSWYDIEECVDDHTPIWPDANYQAGKTIRSVKSDCRNIICSDHTQCIHIYYTLDGTTPTRNSRLYHGPFILDTTVPVTPTVVQDQPYVEITVKAIAVQEGNLDSEVVTSMTFKISDPSATTGKGRIWSWGHNVRGQLGLGDGLYGGDPRYPNDIPGAPALVVADHCFDDETQELLPEQNCDPAKWVLTAPQANRFNAQGIAPPSPEVVAIAAGGYHTMALTGQGKLMGWGWNGYGQLGNPTNMPTYSLPSHPADNTQRNLPTSAQFVDPAAESAIFIHTAAGTYHSGAIDVEGNAYMWGNNFEGQLCSGTQVDIVYPTRIISGPVTEDGQAIAGARWVQLSLGQEHTLLLANTGRVYACGSNRVYQLGRERFTPDTGEGDESSCLQTKTPYGCPTTFNIRWPSPVLVQGTDGVMLNRVVKIAAGAYHNLALTADAKVYSWGDNRMNQLGQGPLVNRGRLCCAMQVPFYSNNDNADLEPDGGAGGLGEGTREPDHPWKGYKVLDIAAGAHYSVAVVMNVTGVGCTKDGILTGHQCVIQNPENGLLEQDWDVPRNIDLISDHFRTEAFDFSLDPDCTCTGNLHLPGALANCEEHTYDTLFPNFDGSCSHIETNGTYPCRYSQRGRCTDGTDCRGPDDCGGGYCDRVLRTCSSRCQCGDRSCPATWGDQMPTFGDPVTLVDSWFRRAVKKGNTCGCIPGFMSEACRNYLTIGVVGELPDCCINRLPNAPVPNVAFDMEEWDAFNAENGFPIGRYGSCPSNIKCQRSDPRSCLQDVCIFPDQFTLASGVLASDDDHPEAEIGHKQTCWCYEPNTCVGGNNEGGPCTVGNEAFACAGNPAGYCSKGGGVFMMDGGAAPSFWGDCRCRNATEEEWLGERWNGVFQNISAPLPENRTRPWVPFGMNTLITFWNSNACPYHNGIQWAGPKCRLTKPPFQKYVFGWGDTRAGQLGKKLSGGTDTSTLTTEETLVPPNDQPQNVPRPRELAVMSKMDVIAVTAGNFHSAIITHPQPYDIAVCNLSNVDLQSRGAPVAMGGSGRDAVIGQPFRCDGRILYTWGGNTEGELGLGLRTPSEAVDCISVGDIRVPCENKGGHMDAQRVKPLIGRNISYVTLGYKHSIILLGDCPHSSEDRCDVCYGTNRKCIGCGGITNDPRVLDWCGVCDGDNTTCSGCSREYTCNPETDACLDAFGARIPCSNIEAYHPCHQGRMKGTPCCLDARGNPATPQLTDPSQQEQGEAPGNGPVPCSHFGVTSWRDLPRAGNNYCGHTYDTCDVCDGDHTRCLDCMNVPNGKQTEDFCLVCGGLATTCIGCDGQPEPNVSRRATHDACELCGGDNSTCSLVLLVLNSAPKASAGGLLHMLALSVLAFVWSRSCVY